MHIQNIYAGIIKVTLTASEARELALLLSSAYEYAVDALETATDGQGGIAQEALAAGALAEMLHLAALVCHVNYYGAKEAKHWRLSDYQGFAYPPASPRRAPQHPTPGEASHVD